MTNEAKTVIEHFAVRKSRQQKEAFRRWLSETLQAAGYRSRVDKHKGIWTSHNVVVGDPDRAKVIFTAHYDTCAVLPFPNFITPRNLFWYLVYQLLITFAFLAVVFAVTFCATFLALTALGDAGEWVGMFLGYAVLLFGLWWMLDGKANRHTANDNTSGVVTLLETALSLPQELRQNVCFVFFDNEERGLLGSTGFAKTYKTARKEVLLINFDCVSDGDSIQMFLTKPLKKDAATLTALERAYVPTSEKEVQIVTSFGFYPSDQARVSRGVGVCALKHHKLFGWYMDRIHTGKDTLFDERNITLLRDGSVALAQILSEGE